MAKSREEMISDKVYKENLRGDFSHHPITGKKEMNYKERAEARKQALAKKIK